MVKPNEGNSYIPGLVSIIIPVYNCANYLSKCIASVIRQTYPNFEALLINDGSTDTSGEICQSYKLQDNRLHLTQTPNKGPSAARNTGLKMARGEFLFFLDADDYLEKNTLQLLIEAYRKNHAEMTVGNFRSIKNGSAGIGHKGVGVENALLIGPDIINCARNYLKKPNKFSLFSYCWGRLFKFSIIKKHDLHFDESLHTFEDVAFNFEYLKYSGSVYFINEIVYNHTVVENYSSAAMTISCDPGRMFGFLGALTKIQEYLTSVNSDSNLEQETGHARISLTIIQLVRICGQINFFNLKSIHSFISGIITDRKLRKNLNHYKPEMDESWLLPGLIKLKLVWIIILVCMCKARLRYGGKGVGK